MKVADLYETSCANKKIMEDDSLLNHVEREKLKQLLMSKSLGGFFLDLLAVGIDNVESFQEMTQKQLLQMEE